MSKPDQREVVLRILLEDGKAGLALAGAGERSPLATFAEGAFASRSARSWEPPPPEGLIAGSLDADMDRFFYRWGGSLASVLTALRGRYGGDIDQFLLHLVFMLAQLDSQNAAALARAKGAERVVVRDCELNAQSLADITAIPRESVRRKLASLEAAGLVRRIDGGRYTLGARSDVRGFFHDLGPLFWAGARPNGPAPGGSVQAVHP